MAAEHMAVEDKKGVLGGAKDFKNMDLGALMKDFDPAMLQELLAEEMKDPALQEMVSENDMFGSSPCPSANCDFLMHYAGVYCCY